MEFEVKEVFNHGFEFVDHPACPIDDNRSSEINRYNR